MLSSDSLGERMASNGRGTTIVAWLEYETAERVWTRLMVARQEGGLGFGPPQNLGRVQSHPRLVVSPTGAAAIGFTANNRLQVSFKPPGGDFGPAESLPDPELPEGWVEGLGLTSSGRLVLLTKEFRDEPRAHRLVTRVRLGPGLYSAPQVIADRENWVHFGVDDTGRSVLLWATFDYTTGAWPARATFISEDNLLTTTSELGNVAGDSFLGVASDGYVLAVVSGPNGWKVALRGSTQSRAFTPPEELRLPGPHQLAMNGGGQAIAAYVADVPERPAVRRLARTGQLGPEEFLVAPRDSTAPNPITQQVVMDEQGDAAVLWRDGDARYRLSEDSPTGPPEPLEENSSQTSPGGSDRHALRLVVKPRGRLRLGPGWKVRLPLRCREGCTVRARASIQPGRGRRAVQLPGFRTRSARARIVLRFPVRGRLKRRILSAWRRGSPVRLSISIVASDRSGVLAKESLRRTVLPAGR